MNTLILFATLAALAALAAMLAKYAALIGGARPKLAYARGRDGRRGCTDSTRGRGVALGFNWLSCDACDDYDAGIRLQPVMDHPGRDREAVQAPSWPGFLPIPTIFWLGEKGRRLPPADDTMLEAKEGYRQAKERDCLSAWLREALKGLGSLDGVVPQGSLTKRLPLKRATIRRLHREANKVECSSAEEADEVSNVPDEEDCRNPSRKQRYRYDETEPAPQSLALLDDGPSERHARMERRVRDELRRTFESCGDYDRARFIRAKVARSVPEPLRHVVNQALADAYRAA